MADSQQVKHAAVGRWAEIIPALTGIPADVLDGRHHPCPRCGGTDRFRAFDDFTQTGGVICNQCFAEKNGDGLAAIGWYTGWPFPEVTSRVADYLGLTSGKDGNQINGKPKSNGRKRPAKKLAIEQLEIKHNIGDKDDDETVFSGLVRSKPGITFDAIRRASGQVAKWAGILVAAFPAFNQPWGEPCGYLLMRHDGEDFPAIGKLQARNKHNLKGSADGFVIVGGCRRLESSKTVWKVEGLPDALALAGHLPYRHVVITNIAGAGSVKELPLDWFKGKIVNVVPDADKPGMEGAAKFTKAAAEHAESARLVQLPYDISPDHGRDLRDWLNEGGTFEQLAEIAAKAKPVNAKPEKTTEAVDDPYRLAVVVLGRFPNWVHYRGEFYRWTDPAYENLTEDDVRALVLPVVKSEFDDSAEEQPKKITRSLIANVVECMKAITHEKPTQETPFWLGKPTCRADRCFVTRNAVIDLETVNDGSIQTFSPTPNLFTTNAVNYEFQPEANCPAWLNFLDEVWGIKSDEVLTLQEIFGYALTDDTSQQKLFMFIGPKRSGKGTIARVAAGLIGRRNVCNPILSGLQGDFGLEPLIGKRLAIVGDARISRRADAGVIVERLLSISGEDSLSINRKHKLAITTQLRTRFLLLSNELPRLSDASATLPSRVILLSFTKSFYGSENPKLTDELLAELPGILLWALAGWERLKQRGHFVQPTESRELIAEMEELSSPVLGFVNEICQIGAGLQMPVADIFNAWKSWCKSKGRKPGTSQTLGRKLRAAVPSLRVSQPRMAGRQVRVYEGIGLRANEAS